MRHNQNRRSRGRSRKAPNPLTRSYESNGPDVKVRGTPSHIAEKYGALARDAHSAGDRVAAESYFQHAEHYNRIVAAAQAQQPQQTPNRDNNDDDGDDNRASQPRDENTPDKSSAQDASSQNDGAGNDDGDRRRRRQPRPARSEQDRPEQDRSEQPVVSEPVVNEPVTAEASDCDDGPARVKKPARRKSRKSNGHDETAVSAEAAGGKPDDAPEGAAKSSDDKAPAGDSDSEADTTKDGAAALAAFPD